MTAARKKKKVAANSCPGGERDFPLAEPRDKFAVNQTHGGTEAGDASPSGPLGSTPR